VTRVVDAHAHYVPEKFLALPEGVPANEWPAMETLPDGRAKMLIDGKEFRIFEPAYWDVAGRIAVLDEEGIALQVLSPLPELLGYWFHERTTAAMAEHINKSIAAAVSAAPERLAGLGMLPLQSEALSVAMVGEIAALGLRGVLVASNVNGVSIADRKFYPVFEALQARDLAVFVHGYRPVGTERLLGSALLGPIVGVPQDTAMAIASFMMTDILGIFPKLRLGFSHGGGSFGGVLARMDHVWREFPQMREVLKEPPADYVKKFYFDTVTFGAPYLRYLMDVVGPDALMAGSDGPTPIGQHGLAAFVAGACGGDAAVEAKVLAGTAARFFGLG
jgi:aminocarboxymuconate-semialdehyde decarboxylase